MANETAPTGTSVEHPAGGHGRVPAVRQADLSVPAALADPDLRGALSADGADRAAAHRLDPGAAAATHLRRPRRGAASQGRIGRGDRRLREVARRRARPRPGGGQRIPPTAGRRGGNRPQGARCDAQCPHRARPRAGIAATKSAAMANVRGIATEAAAAIVERLIGIAPASRDMVAAAVADALKR